MATVDPSPFHEGERHVQALTGGGAGGAGIRSAMPDQHRAFFSLLPILFLALPDEEGRPLATVVAGPPGFVTSPDPTTLRVEGRLSPSDPASSHLTAGQPIGVLGLQFETRRRNRTNGAVAAVDEHGFTIAVAQSFGNCAKYIQTRKVHSTPFVPSGDERLPALDDEAKALLRAADTFFVASGTLDLPSGGMDISHRGGRPGFVKIAGESLVIPDYRGNRYFNTLGNLVCDPRAALLFVDFATGDLLHLTGRVTIVWQPAEVTPTGTERVWNFEIAGAVRRRRALPLQFTFVEFSPATLETGSW